MKKIFLLFLVIYLPLFGFGQTTKKLIVDTIKARVDSVYLKSPIAIKQPVVSTQIIKAPLFLQGSTDTAATKAYARSVGGSTYTVSNGLHSVGNDFQLGDALTGSTTISGNYDLNIQTLGGFFGNLQNGAKANTWNIYSPNDYALMDFSVTSGTSKSGSFQLDTIGIKITSQDTSLQGDYYATTKRWVKNQVAANSGGTLGNGWLKADNVNHTFNPYANVGEAPHGYPYWYADYAYYWLRFDTSVYIKSLTQTALTVYGTNTNAIYGNDLGSGIGVEGASTNGVGGYFASLNKSGLVTYTTNGYTTAKFMTSGSDSVTIRKNGTIHQYYGGVEKLSTEITGMIKIGNDTVPVRKPIAADTTNLSGRIGDTFIDSSLIYWINTRNGRGGWKHAHDMLFLPFAILWRRRYFNPSLMGGKGGASKSSYQTSRINDDYKFEHNNLRNLF